MAFRRAPLAALALLTPVLQAQRQTREVTKLADGVYAVIYSEMKTDPVRSNSLIIIGDDGVCVIDAHYTPSAARADIATIRSLTKLPVTYLVTTHWHDDHIFGNQEYVKAFPGITIVAHAEARKSMVAKALEHQQELEAFYTKAVPRIAEHLKSGTDDKGQPLSAKDKEHWTVNLPVYRDFLADVKTVKIVLPMLTFDSSLTLFLGQREIKVLHFGNGNTRGDAVIYLPRERIAAVGDLVVWPVPFIFGGFPVSWAKGLASIKTLDPAVMMPGHGPLMRDFTYLDQVSALLTSMATQVGDAVRKGLSIEDTRKAVDFSAMHDQMVQGDPDREDTWQGSIVQAGVESAWKEAKALTTAR